MYDPRNWYWLADDGRLFSSSRQALIPDSDAEYQQWLTVNGQPSEWPRDDAGEQSDAALQEVLKPSGMFANLEFYTTDVRNRTLNAGVTINGRPFASDPLTLGSLNSAFIYTQGNAASEFSWKLPDGTWVTLNKADVATLQAALSKYGQDCFDCEADTLEDIAAGTVTTREQVDAAFAAVPNSFTGMMVEFKKRQRSK